MLFGIDLGGTKIEGVVLDPENGLRVVARRRVPTEPAKGYAHIVSRVVELVRALENETSCEAKSLGIGTPGVLDLETNLIRGSNTQCLNKMPLRDDLQKLLGIPVAIENDANCFALAEDQLGAAKGSRLTFGIIMGTGVGGGLVVNGRIWPGYQGIAGEWGHNVLEPGGSACYCGKSGCVETVLSGPSLLRFFNTRSQSSCTRLEQVTELAERGDKLAGETLDRLVHWFGIGVGTLTNILDPDVIVLGGGVSNVSRLYSDGIESVKQNVFNPNPRVRVVKNALGDSAGVFGAAMLSR